jgi:hypothetical protein
MGRRRDDIGSFGIEVQHPDEFVLHLLNVAPGAVVAAARYYEGFLVRAFWEQSVG